MSVSILLIVIAGIAGSVLFIINRFTEDKNARGDESEIVIVEGRSSIQRLQLMCYSICLLIVSLRLFSFGGYFIIILGGFVFGLCVFFLVESMYQSQTVTYAEDSLKVFLGRDKLQHKVSIDEVEHLKEKGIGFLIVLKNGDAIKVSSMKRPEIDEIYRLSILG